MPTSAKINSNRMSPLIAGRTCGKEGSELLDDDSDDSDASDDASDESAGDSLAVDVWSPADCR